MSSCTTRKSRADFKLNLLKLWWWKIRLRSSVGHCHGGSPISLLHVCRRVGQFSMQKGGGILIPPSSSSTATDSISTSVNGLRGPSVRLRASMICIYSATASSAAESVDSVQQASTTGTARTAHSATSNYHQSPPRSHKGLK